MHWHRMLLHRTSNTLGFVVNHVIQPFGKSEFVGGFRNESPELNSSHSKERIRNKLQNMTLLSIWFKYPDSIRILIFFGYFQVTFKMTNGYYLDWSNILYSTEIPINFTKFILLQTIIL